MGGGVSGAVLAAFKLDAARFWGKALMSAPPKNPGLSRSGQLLDAP